MNVKDVRFLANQEQSTTVGPDFISTRYIVPLPTLAPSTTTTTTQEPNIGQETEDTPFAVDCEPQPIGIVAHIRATILKVFKK